MGDSDWRRPHFKRGGGDAFLLFAAFGEFSGEMRLEARHRSRGVPKGCTIERFTRGKHSDQFEAFLGGYLGRTVTEDSPSVGAAVHASPHLLLLRGPVVDPPDLLYLRDAIGVLTGALELGAIAVLDATAFRWWTAKHWTEQIFEPDAPRPVPLVSILTSEDARGPGFTWFHTRGMRKFGRPDIGVTGVPEDRTDDVVDLCVRFIEMQAFGAVVEEGQPIRMKSLPAGMSCRHKGDLDDPAYNNVHFQMAWPLGE